jgi:hypothetical protein
VRLRPQQRFLYRKWQGVVQVCMATAEEFVVVVIYLFLGFTLEKLTAEQTGMIQSRGWCCGRRMGKLRTEEHQLDSSKGPQQVVYNEVSPEYLGQA